MKRNICMVFTVVAFFIACLPQLCMASPQVVLNGEKLSFDVPPIIENGRTLVPLRSVFEALGADILWDDATQTVTATKGTLTITLKIGVGTAFVNNKAVSLDVPGRIVDGRTLVPLRFVSEAMGCDVGWDDESQTVIITDNSNPNAETVIISGPKGVFTIFIPNDWGIRDGNEYYIVEFIANPEDSMFPMNPPKIRINVMDMRKDKWTLDQIKAKIYSNITKNDPNIKFVSEKNIVLDGLPGLQLDAYEMVAGDKALLQDTVVVNESLCYEIITGYYDGESKELIKQLFEVVYSIQLVDPYN